MTAPTDKPTIESGDKSIGNEAGGQGPSELRRYEVTVCSTCGAQVERNYRDRWECREHGDGITIRFVTVQEVRSEPSHRQWRVGSHYGIHIYEQAGEALSDDDRPVATALTPEFAAQIVAEHNRSVRSEPSVEQVEAVVEEVEGNG